MLSFITPLLIGFFSGFHCVAMCGGLCAAICQRQQARQVLITNLGRILTYTLLGVVFAGVIQGASLRLNLANWGWLLRLVMGMMLIITGVVLILKDKTRLMTGQKPWPFWPRAALVLQKIQQRNDLAALWLKGMLWGLIPCGLVYGMLVISATTADAFRGGQFMFFFGLGTVLPLVLSQAFIRRLLLSGSHARFRVFAGVLVLLLGLWLLVSVQFAHALIPENNRFFTELAAVMALCVP